MTRCSHGPSAPMPVPTAMVQREAFAPILYLLRCETLPQAIALHKVVPRGLPSSIFANDRHEAGCFLSVDGSDCGIAKVNTGPAGAAIGGAYGGEKGTDAGREAGRMHGRPASATRSTPSFPAMPSRWARE